MKKLELYCLKYADSSMGEDQIFFDGDANKICPITFSVYLIKADDRNILVDAGCTTMPRFVMENFYSPVEVLKQLGMEADEITDVIITHAHHDHIDALRCFEKAKVYLTLGEYERGRSYIPEHMEVHLVEDAFEIVPHVTIVKWGGHTPSSAIVEIDQGETISVLAGDECYVNRCLTDIRPTGNSKVPEQSLAFVKKYREGNYRVHTCHDPSLKTGKIL